MNKSILIPKDYAHGFIALSENVEVIYKVNNYFDRELERAIIWNDPEINILWPENILPILSEKDQIASLLSKSNLLTF